MEVDTYRPFFVLGEVTFPGQYPYVPNMTVENAIAIGMALGGSTNMVLHLLAIAFEAGVALELERIANHVGDLGALCDRHDIVVVRPHDALADADATAAVAEACKELAK